MKSLFSMLVLSMLPTTAVGAPLPPQQGDALTQQLQDIANDPAMPLAWRQRPRRHGQWMPNLFRIASISKLVTALGTMKMVEQGDLASRSASPTPCTTARSPFPERRRFRTPCIYIKRKK